MKCWRCEERIGSLAKITAYAAPELTRKTAEDDFVCPYCGPEYGPDRHAYLGRARLYFKDGTIELRERPTHYTHKVLRRPTLEYLSINSGGIGPGWRGTLHVLQRRDYAYGVDFIGPLRDSDWHEY